jgi:hypothetical protein
MAKKKKPMQEGIVCPDHPNTQAVDRCHACHRPVCDECAKEIKGNVYCSVQCGADDARTTENISKQKKKLPLGKIAGVNVLLGLVGGGFWIKENKPELFNKVKEQTQNAAADIKEKAASIDPAARSALNKRLDEFQFAVDNESTEKALAFFTDQARFYKKDAKQPARASSLIKLIKTYADDDFKVEKEGAWKRNSDGSKFAVSATLHMIKREITGNVNRTLPVTIYMRKDSSEWKIEKVKAHSDVTAKRGA